MSKTTGTMRHLWRLSMAASVPRTSSGPVTIEAVTPDEAEAAEGVTLGAWWDSNSGIWYRGPSSKPLAAVYPGVDVNVQLFTDAGVEPLGPFPALSTAMLATDARLREAGCVLPETVVLTGICLRYSDGRTGAWGPGYSRVYPPCGDGHLGGASSIEEALDVLESEEVREMGWVTDTAIARAQLEEREAATIRESRTVENADSTEPTAALPLAGVVLSGEWMTPRETGRSGDYTMLGASTPCAVTCHVGAPGHWTIYVRGACLAAGIGTREDAIERAKELGAEVSP